MDTLYYPQVNDLDELLGFSAARKRAEEATTNPTIYEEPNFIPNRVFVNHVDTFNAKHIASVCNSLQINIVFCYIKNIPLVLS